MTSASAKPLPASIAAATLFDTIANDTAVAMALQEAMIRAGVRADLAPGFLKFAIDEWQKLSRERQHSVKRLLSTSQDPNPRRQKHV